MKYIEITQSGSFHQDITIGEDANDFIILEMLKFNGASKKSYGSLIVGSI